MVEIKFKLSKNLIVLNDFADHYYTGDKIFIDEDPTIFYTIRAKVLTTVDDKWYYAHLLDRPIEND